MKSKCTSRHDFLILVPLVGHLLTRPKTHFQHTNFGMADGSSRAAPSPSDSGRQGRSSSLAYGSPRSFAHIVILLILMPHPISTGIKGLTALSSSA